MIENQGLWGQTHLSQDNLFQVWPIVFIHLFTWQ